MENKLWGKAKGYLEKSLNLEPSAQTFKLMARYFDTQGETENALEAYRQAEGTSNQLIVVDNNKVIDKTPEQDN